MRAFHGRADAAARNWDNGGYVTALRIRPIVKIAENAIISLCRVRIGRGYGRRDRSLCCSRPRGENSISERMIKGQQYFAFPPGQFEIKQIMSLKNFQSPDLRVNSG